MKNTLCVFLLWGWSLSFPLRGGVFSSNPNFPPEEFGSIPGVDYTVTSSGFAEGWKIRDIRIFDIDLNLTGCGSLDVSCVETDASPGSGHFSMSAIINGTEFRESGPMQLVTVVHNRSFLGTELMEDVMFIDILWMRAYPPGGIAPLMIWLNPFGTMVARNAGGGMFELTLDLTARTKLRTETGVFSPFEEVEGPLIPLVLIPEPSGYSYSGILLLLATGLAWRTITGTRHS